jgi:general secretion pathway protein I
MSKCADFARGLTRSRGFTLVEVMLALAILGLALTMLMRSAANSMFATSQAQMLGVVTDLARGKMYDLDERLAKDGLPTGTETTRGDFEAEGWAQVTWEAKIEPVDLPNFETMEEVGKEASRDGGKGLAQKTGAKVPAGGSGSDSSEEKAQNATSSFIGQFYGLISELLKVTLEVKWQVLGRPRDLKVITYATDPAAMTKASDDLVNSLGGGGGGGGKDPDSGTPPVPPKGP